MNQPRELVSLWQRQANEAVDIAVGLHAEVERLRHALARLIEVCDGIAEAEAVDARMGYPMPGDCALAAYLGLVFDEALERARASLAEGGQR